MRSLADARRKRYLFFGQCWRFRDVPAGMALKRSWGGSI
jgi:hypothetical protein